jgi:NAD(P)-dependent dehydrogenase (short-subunit alcohol dehydrogenase family)
MSTADPTSGSAGIGLETARLARGQGAEVILTGRDPERLERAARELGALSSTAFDATDEERLERFFEELHAPIDHLMLSGGGPYYSPLPEMDFEQARQDIYRHLLLPVRVGRHATGKVRPGGSLIFISGTGGRRRGVGLTLIGAITAALPALVANLALELAPIRANVIAPGFVDTPLSATLLGEQLDARREELRTTLPIRRAGGRRGAGRPHHVQLRAHRRDLRRRRRPAARRLSGKGGACDPTSFPAARSPTTSCPITRKPRAS